MSGTSIIRIALTACTAIVTLSFAQFTSAQDVPRYIFDPSWPKDLPNNWKNGGIMGIAIDPNDDIWVYNRPNDLTSIELSAENDPPIAECCARPPSMFHFDKNGNLINWFDAPQGHGMDVDSVGFAYLGQDTVRKYDTSTGEVVAEIARVPERENGAPVGLQPWPPERALGMGGRGPVYGFLAEFRPPPGSESPPSARPILPRRR